MGLLYTAGFNKGAANLSKTEGYDGSTFTYNTLNNSELNKAYGQGQYERGLIEGAKLSGVNRFHNKYEQGYREADTKKAQDDVRAFLNQTNTNVQIYKRAFTEAKKQTDQYKAGYALKLPNESWNDTTAKMSYYKDGIKARAHNDGLSLDWSVNQNNLNINIKNLYAPVFEDAVKKGGYDDGYAGNNKRNFGSWYMQSYTQGAKKRGEDDAKNYFKEDLSRQLDTDYMSSFIETVKNTPEYIAGYDLRSIGSWKNNTARTHYYWKGSWDKGFDDGYKGRWKNIHGGNKYKEGYEKGEAKANKFNFGQGNYSSNWHNW